MFFQIIFIQFVCVRISFSMDSSVNEKYNACECETKKIGDIKRPLYPIEGDADESLAYSISCCAKEYIGTSRGDFNVTWSFAGEETEYSTLAPNPKCFGQIAFTNKVDFKEAGNHTCTIVAQDGTKFVKFVKVRIHAWKKERAIPIAHNASDTIYTDQGSSIVLNCTYYLETGSDQPDVYWRKFYFNGTEYFERIASTLGDIQESSFNYSTENTVYFVYQLEISNVTENHFGNYSCKAITANSIISQNISVVEGANPLIIAEEKSRIILIVTLISFTCFLIMLYVTFRCRYKIAWKWMNATSSFRESSAASSEFNYDIFIIHGPTASFWVYSVLLNKLESEWSYDCFVPDRDILGGEELGEMISEKLSESKRIIVVVSECLPQSQWCSYVTVQAIHKSLTNSSRVVAITFPDTVELKNTLPETQSIVDVLKFLKKIPCPLEFAPKTLSWHMRLSEAETRTASEKEGGIRSPEVTLLQEDERKLKKEIDRQSKENEKFPKRNQSPLNTFACISTPQLNLSSLSSPCFESSSTSHDLKILSRRPSESTSESNMTHTYSDLPSYQLRSNITVGSLKILQTGRQMINTKSESKNTEIKDYEESSSSQNADLEFQSKKNNILLTNQHINFDLPLAKHNFLPSTATPIRKPKRKGRIFFRIFVENSNKIFWQKLRLHLPPKKRRTPNNRKDIE